MMELLLSNYLPAKFPSTKTSKEIFERFLESADQVRIASGYISSEALIELKRIVEINKRPKIDLLIGMHFFDKFTRPQYQAAMALHGELASQNLGKVQLSKSLKFHGKMYSFSKEESPIGCVVGSSNLSSLISSTQRLYEVDLLIEEQNYIRQIHDRDCDNGDHRHGRA